MSRYRSRSTATQYALLTVAAWLAGQAEVFAAVAQTGTSSGGSSGSIWIWTYMIVVLLTAFGMIAVFKSSNRRDRNKPEVYPEIRSKDLPKDMKKPWISSIKTGFFSV